MIRRVPLRGVGGRATFHTIANPKDPRWGKTCALCGYQAKTGHVICEVLPQGLITPLVICGDCLEAMYAVQPPDVSEVRMTKIAESSGLKDWIIKQEASMQ